MSRIIGGEGQFICIEADENTYNLLTLNITQNNLNNVTALNHAVADVNDNGLAIYKGGSTSNSIVEGVIRKGSLDTVKAKKIDTILMENNFSPNFIILTINGAELRLLNSCRNFLRNTAFLRIITPGWYADKEGKIGPRIVALLSSLGFKVSHTPGMHIFAYKY